MSCEYITHLLLINFKSSLFSPSIIGSEESVTELLVNANSSIFQLYHGKSKLIFNEMVMMRSTLY